MTVRTDPPAPPPSYVVVIPTLGRPCLQDCLNALAEAHGPLPHQVVLADDRPDTPDLLPVRVPDVIADCTVTVTLEGRGPAAARNAGWRAAAATEWVAFLDDDVRVGPRWRAELMADLVRQPAHVAGVQGVIEVPLPPDRRPTDWERGTAGLAIARWITADMAYRRSALIAVGGFDERFPRVPRGRRSRAAPFGSWAICPHDPADGCGCRKPQPFLVQMAAAELGVDPADCVVIGDIGSDVAAAYAAGARAILVPAPATRPGETAGVPTAAGLAEAAAALLDGRPLPCWAPR
jgi:HAD-hyrolase-like/Glycosyl transferase family 2